MSDLRAYLSDLYAIGGERLGRQIDAWRNELDSEIFFWERWFATKGYRWPEDYEARLKGMALAPWRAALLPSNGRPRILDVGAGPISNAGHVVPGREADFRAIDPLARAYQRIMAENNVIPPVRTEFGFAEDLSCRFAPSSFDLVISTNALDHSIDPMWGILEMLIVTEVGGAIALCHEQNEAVRHNYKGLHHWNFNVQDGAFVIWTPDVRLNVTSMLSGFADVESELKESVFITLRKRAEPPFDLLEHHRRLRAGLLAALLPV